MNITRRSAYEIRQKWPGNQIANRSQQSRVEHIIEEWFAEVRDVLQVEVVLRIGSDTCSGDSRTANKCVLMPLPQKKQQQGVHWRIRMPHIFGVGTRGAVWVRDWSGWGRAPVWR